MRLLSRSEDYGLSWKNPGPTGCRLCKRLVSLLLKKLHIFKHHEIVQNWPQRRRFWQW